MANYPLEQSGQEVQALLNKVQTPDSTPTTGSTNLVTSGGVKAALDQKYAKPNTGIPKTDLAAAVQTSLGKADTAIQSLIGYQYMGVATTTTNPGTPTQKVFYIATAVGTYTNFGLSVAEGEVAFLKYNGSAWSKEVTGAATAAKVTELGQKVDMGLERYSVFGKGSTQLDTRFTFVAGRRYKIVFESVGWSISSVTSSTAVIIGLQKISGGVTSNVLLVRANAWGTYTSKEIVFTSETNDYYNLILRADSGVKVSFFIFDESAREETLDLLSQVSVYSPAWEIGSMNITNSGWSYTDSTTRVRLAKDTTIHLYPGDVFGLTDYTNKVFAYGWKKKDGTYGNGNGWKTANIEVTEEGDYVFLLKNATETTISDVTDLSKYFFVKPIKERIAENKASIVELNTSFEPYAKITNWNLLKEKGVTCAFDEVIESDGRRSASLNYCTFDYIPVSEDVVYFGYGEYYGDEVNGYKLNASGSGYWAFYNAAHELISMGVKQTPAPAGAKYAAISFHYVSGKDPGACWFTDRFIDLHSAVYKSNEAKLDVNNLIDSTNSIGINWILGQISTAYGTFVGPSNRYFYSPLLPLQGRRLKISIKKGFDFGVFSYDSDGVFIERTLAKYNEIDRLADAVLFFDVANPYIKMVIFNRTTDIDPTTIRDIIKIEDVTGIYTPAESRARTILNRGTIVSDNWKYTSADGSHLQADGDTGLAYVLYNTAASGNYGEQKQILVLSVFPLDQPFSREDYVAFKLGEQYGGDTFDKFNDLNLLMLSDRVRVFFDGRKVGETEFYWYYRDFIKSTKTFTSLTKITFKRPGSDTSEDFSYSNFIDYLSDNGYTYDYPLYWNLYPYYPVFSGVFAEGDNKKWIIIPSVSINPGTNPVLAYTEDNGATLQFVNIIPYLCVDEAQIAFLDGLMYCIFRGADGNYEQGYRQMVTSDDYGATFSASMWFSVGTTRPQMLKYKNAILTGSTLLQWQDSRYKNDNSLHRSGFVLRYGSTADPSNWKEIIRLQTLRGLLYYWIIDYKNTLYMSYVTGGLYSDKAASRKDQIGFVRIGEIINGELIID